MRGVGIGDVFLMATGENAKIVMGSDRYPSRGTMTPGVVGLKLECTSARHASIIESGPGRDMLITNCKVQRFFGTAMHSRHDRCIVLTASFINTNSVLS